MSIGWPHARTAVSWLLAGSGIASIAAARERWWPACPWGEFDSTQCLIVQDDSYGSLARPWLETGYTAELQALSIALLGLAIAFLPKLWLRRPVAVIVLSSGALTTASFVVAGWLYYAGLGQPPRRLLRPAGGVRRLGTGLAALPGGGPGRGAGGAVRRDLAARHRLAAHVPDARCC